MERTFVVVISFGCGPILSLVPTIPRCSRQIKRSNGNKDRDYEVEMILSSQMRGGRAWYLIKWKGFDDSWNTWEPEDVMNCPDKVNEFNKNKIEQDTKVSKENKAVIVKPPLVKERQNPTLSKLLPVVIEDDVEVMEFTVIGKTNEKAVLFKINDQYDLIPYNAACNQRKFQIPLINYYERNLMFTETDTNTEVLIAL